MLHKDFWYCEEDDKWDGNWYSGSSCNWYHLDDNVDYEYQFTARDTEGCVEGAAELGCNVVTTGAVNRFNGNGIDCFC